MSLSCFLTLLSIVIICNSLYPVNQLVNICLLAALLPWETPFTIIVFMKAQHFILLCSILLCMVLAGAYIASKQPITQAPSHTLSQDNINPYTYKNPITFTNGESFSLADAPAPFVFLFMGFTQCPDMCPTTLSLLETLYQALPAEKREKTQFIFITLHPEADSPEMLNSYFAYANLPILAASLPVAQVEALNRHYGLFLERKDITTLPPTIYHTGDILLLNARGELMKRFPFDADYHALLAEAERIIP